MPRTPNACSKRPGPESAAATSQRFRLNQGLLGWPRPENSRPQSSHSIPTANSNKPLVICQLAAVEVAADKHSIQ